MAGALCCSLVSIAGFSAVLELSEEKAGGDGKLVREFQKTKTISGTKQGYISVVVASSVVTPTRQRGRRNFQRIRSRKGKRKSCSSIWLCCGWARLVLWSRRNLF